VRAEPRGSARLRGAWHRLRGCEVPGTGSAGWQAFCARRAARPRPAARCLAPAPFERPPAARCLAPAPFERPPAARCLAPAPFERPL